MLFALRYVSSPPVGGTRDVTGDGKRKLGESIKIQGGPDKRTRPIKIYGEEVDLWLVVVIGRS